MANKSGSGKVRTENKNGANGELLRGLAPIADGNSEVLILGSMPSVRSLAAGEYYAHPQNRFWRVMFAVLGGEFSAVYSDKTALLLANGVALWDAIGECRRRGSGDGEIRDEKPNDLAGFLASHPRITRIATNGGKAASTVEKFFPEISFVRLPSTSPANAAKSIDDLVAAYASFLLHRK